MFDHCRCRVVSLVLDWCFKKVPIPNRAISDVHQGPMASPLTEDAADQPSLETEGKGKGQLARLAARLPPTSAGRRGPRVVGAAVAMPPLRSSATHRKTLAREFTAATAENCMKWGSLQQRDSDRWDFEAADEFVDFCERHALAIKGHTLVWHQQHPKFLSTRLEQGMTGEELLRYMEKHIKTVVGRYKGKMRSWDVLNEVVADNGTGLRKTMFAKLTGDVFVSKAFRWAHEADPDALLLYNDYGISEVNPKSDFTFDLMKRLLDDGVPVHGVGMQGHMRAGHVNVDSIVANMRRFTNDLGLLVNLSEVDIRIAGCGETREARLSLQADLCRELCRRCFALDGFEGLTFWGFTDKHSWVHSFFGPDEPLIFDANYEKKPSYHGCCEGLFAASATLRDTPKASKDFDSNRMNTILSLRCKDNCMHSGCKISGGLACYVKRGGFVAWSVAVAPASLSSPPPTHVMIDVATGMKSGSSVMVRAKTVDGDILAECPVRGTGGYSSYECQHFAMVESLSPNILESLDKVFLCFARNHAANVKGITFYSQ